MSTMKLTRLVRTAAGLLPCRARRRRRPGHDARLAEHRHGGKVEVVEGLSRRQSCFGEVPLDPSAATLGNLQFGQYGEQSCSRPALLVRALGELRPEPGHGG
jgi:hypothetical protein